MAYKSLNKFTEILCGDKVEMLETEDSNILILADGMGSGVKANILATLTARMLSIMIARNMDIRTAVKAVADTLPICSVRNLAYATFTVLVSEGNGICLLQYDNPDAILLRNGKSVDLSSGYSNVRRKRDPPELFSVSDRRYADTYE